MDFPINDKSLALMNALDDITSKYGGRIYLAKDSRLSEKSFIRMENRLESFKEYRKKINSKDIFESAQSKRLGL